MTSKDKAALLGDDEASQKQDGPRLGKRHWLIFWAFLGMANLFVLRVDMSIALVAMATQNYSSLAMVMDNQSGALSNLTANCADHDAHRTDAKQLEFDWNNTLQGFVLSAFYYGYFATQIPGGLMAKRIGGKHLFTMAMAGCSVLALVTPVAARFSVYALIAVRVLQGCLQGVVFPSMTSLFSKWVPENERSRMVAFTYAGCQAGTVVGTLSAGYLCETSLGWPIVFYIEGVLGMLWCLGWVFFTFETPAKHPRITEMERVYIESSIERPKHKELSTPWRSILSCPGLYAIMAAHFANDWGCFAVLTCLPKFMKDILDFNLSQNGVLSSLPYVVTWVCNIVAGTLADYLRKPNRLRTVHVRKLMVTVGLIMPAALLLAAAYIPGCGKAPVVILLTISMGFSGFTVAGHSCNHLDIAPAFAGIMFAMTNTIGTTSGFIGPALAGALTHKNDTRASWETFFLISGAVYGVGGLIFVLFARGDVQPWAKVQGSDTEVIVPSPSAKYGSVQAAGDGHEDEDD